MKLHNYFWVFGVFVLPVLLAGCLSNNKSPDIVNPPVATPSLQMSPNRAYNTGPISITLDTATANASIYYTLDGSAPSATNGALYTGPFNLAFDNTNDARFRGYVVLRAIGIKKNYPDSSIARQIFQIFPSEQIKGLNGNPVSGGPKTGTGSGYDSGAITVTLSLNNGYITDVSFVGSGESDGYWWGATRYASEFFTVMNSWDFVPAVSGASYSGGGIRDAAKEAIDKILDK